MSFLAGFLLGMVTLVGLAILACLYGPINIPERVPPTWSDAT